LQPFLRQIVATWDEMKPMEITGGIFVCAWANSIAGKFPWHHMGEQQE
jgi:hypothetical protein